MVDVIEERPTIKEIADFYGVEPQAHQLVEEMAELTQALNKLWRKTRIEKVNPVSDKASELTLHIAEEIADVKICLEQVEYLLGVEDSVNEWKEKKIKRQQDRLRKQGYSEGSGIGGADILEWTPLEIAGSYRRSGEKASQIQIIAECNACSKEQIKQILREQGFEIKEKEKKTVARPKKEEPIASPEEERNTVVDALREKIRSIETELLELADKQNELRKREEELTKQYAAIRELIGNITKEAV